MFFKGSIYITDPCYISREEDWMSSDGFDIENYVIGAPEFTDYILEDTGIGDGFWSVYVVDKKDCSVSDIIDIIEDGNFDDFSVIGTFSADAGMSCVVYKNEADIYNPDWKREVIKRVYTKIKDFEGDITVYYDSTNEELHFIGIGKNKTFFTA